MLWSAGESFHLTNIIFDTNIACQQQIFLENFATAVTVTLF